MVSCYKCSTEKGAEFTSSEGSEGCDECITTHYMADGECVEKPTGVARGEKVRPPVFHCSNPLGSVPDNLPP